MVTSSQVALQVVQQAIAVLAKWADSKFLAHLNQVSESCIDSAVKEAQKILSWPTQGEPQALRLLFDYVKLEKEQTEKHYWIPQSIDDIAPLIPYPVTEKPNLDSFKQEVKTDLDKLEEEDCDNLSLLTLILEKFGSFISFGEENIAFIDIVKSTAAVAAALVNNSESENITLIAGDLSGIQKFIYTISSDGALKSLRARSFYLELVTEEVVQQLLEELQLTRTNVIYAGGGNLYILGGDIAKVNKTVNYIREKVNKWLMNSFQGKLFLALDCLSINTQCLNKKEFAEYWNKINKKLAIQKSQKFKEHIQIGKFLIKRISYEPCRVCHRDDLPKLKNLKNEGSSPACWLCIKMFDLGDKLFKIKAIIRSSKSVLSKSIDKVYRFTIADKYYFLCENLDDALTIDNAENIFLINNWQLKKYQHQNTVPMLVGNYSKLTNKPNESGYIRSTEMAEKAQESGCIPRVGYLQMDVDNLGKIFADGFEDNKLNLLSISGLSRQISYFFKVYLNSLADKRDANFIQHIQNELTVLNKAQFLTDQPRKNLLFIYAGGDDLFISGAWNEIVEFAFDIYQSFRAYTGHNPNITLSGGISIDEPKFPIYQSARFSKEAENSAKVNGRDSLELFGEVFKWEEWINIEDIDKIVDDKDKYKIIQVESKPEIYGILSFVKQLTEQLDFSLDYSRSFIRSLLETAEAQEELIQKNSEQKTEIRYYLHLPKLAYAFSRLPAKIHNHPNFVPVRRSLLSPRNAPYFRAIAIWIELLTRTRRLK